MTVCFVANGSIEWAGARLRAFWIAELLDDALVANASESNFLPAADVYVFTKSLNIKAMMEIKEKGKRLIWDLCDPLHWFSPKEAEQVIKLVDAVTASNQELANDFAKWAGKHW